MYRAYRELNLCFPHNPGAKKTINMRYWPGFEGAEQRSEKGGNSVFRRPDWCNCLSVCWFSPRGSLFSSRRAGGWRSSGWDGWSLPQCWVLCGPGVCWRCPGWREGGHWWCFQLLSLCAAGSSGSMRCSRRTTQWCNGSGCSRWFRSWGWTWWWLVPWLFLVCGGSGSAAEIFWPVMQCWCSRRGPQWDAHPETWCCSLSPQQHHRWSAEGAGWRLSGSRQQSLWSSPH